MTKISIRYPLIEIATGFMFLLVYSKFGLTFQTVIFCLMSVALLVMIVVDLEHYIIPDSVHVALIILALLYHYIIGTSNQLNDAVMASGLMLLLALFMHYGYSYLRGRVMLGFGDVKFFAVAGLWLGLWPLVIFLFLSGVFGVILGIIWKALGRGEVFPFGPALALALFICVIYKNDINLLYYINYMTN